MAINRLHDMKNELRKGKPLATFIVNCAIGCIIALVILIMNRLDWGDTINDRAFDLLIQHELETAGREPVTLDKSPLLVVEIDDGAYVAWGKPGITPRRKLAEMIRLLADKEPRLIVLDILLEGTDPADPAGDAALRDAIGDVGRTAPKTRVIVPVSVSNIDGDIRPTIVDDLFAMRNRAGERYVYRALPEARASVQDMKCRFWGMYGIGRTPGRIEVLWSVPVLASALLEGKEGELEHAAAAVLSAGGSGHGGPSIILGGKRVDIPSAVPAGAGATGLPVAGESHGAAYTQRIRYLLAPDAPSTSRIRITAGNLPRMPLEPLSGKAVLIGNAHADSGDIRQTPVGSLPGMYVVANGINTIMTGRQPVHLPGWAHFLVEVLVIVVGAYAFLHLGSLTAQMATSVLFLGLLVPLSWFIFREWGLFFNFIIPVAGMALHRTAVGIEEAIVHKGRKHHH